MTDTAGRERLREALVELADAPPSVLRDVFALRPDLLERLRAALAHESKDRPSGSVGLDHGQCFAAPWTCPDPPAHCACGNVGTHVPNVDCTRAALSGSKPSASADAEVKTSASLDEHPNGRGRP